MIRLEHTFKVGVWTLILLNLMMALGCIWVFVRMSPVIESIIERNENSLQACEDMLAALALAPVGGIEPLPIQAFEAAFDRAQRNTTEPREPEILKALKAAYPQAFEGQPEAKVVTIETIKQLGQVNRQAMLAADQRAKRFGYAGAWGVVFMASGVFFAGLMVKRNLARELVWPLEEIHRAILARSKGDHFHRCVTQGVPKDVRPILEDFNRLLDTKENLKV